MLINVDFCMARFSLLLLFFYSSFVLSEIYHWTDKDGKRHYSDVKPLSENDKYQVKDYTPTLASTLDVEFVLHGYSLPLDVENKIRLSAAKLQEGYLNVLSLPLKPIPKIKIRIFNSKSQFRRYYSNVAGGNGMSPHNVAGFFSPRLFEVALYKTDIDSMLRTIVHELSHLLLGNTYGYIPTWLNEGLAEYFEQISVKGLSVEIRPNYHSDKRIKSFYRSNGLLSLRYYFSKDSTAWYSANDTSGSAYYDHAWSLVFFLMSSRDGKLALSRMFAHLQTYPYSPHVNFTLVHRYYPGGLSALQDDWIKWIPRNRIPKTF
jgi:hypothetical protein